MTDSWKEANDRLVQRANKFAVASLCVFTFAIGVFFGGWPYSDPQESRTALAVGVCAVIVAVVLLMASTATIGKATAMLRVRSAFFRAKADDLQRRRLARSAGA